MAYENLKVMAKSYLPAERQELSKLAARYSRSREREVMELAAIASDVSIDEVVNLGLEPESNPQLHEAVRLLKVNLDGFGSTSPESLGGHINKVKGKYFEVLVRNKLNNGERVGHVQLEPGQTATLADSENQPGWDLRIVEKSTGEAVQDLQLKATDSMSYVKTALEKYPDIKVVVPSEFDSKAALQDDVIATDISNKALSETTTEQLGEAGESTTKDLIGNSAEFGFDALPIVSAAVIAVTEGGMVMLGRSTMKDAIQRGRGRLVRAGAYSTIGATLGLTPIGPVAVPATIALRITEGRIRNIAAAGDHMEEKTREILRELDKPTMSVQSA